jgi:hypothetical protein
LGSVAHRWGHPSTERRGVRAEVAGSTATERLATKALQLTKPTPTWYYYATMKTLTVRLNDEVADLIEQRNGELRDMSINTLMNVAVRRLLVPDQNRAVEANDDVVAAALKRVMARDAAILEALKNI